MSQQEFNFNRPEPEPTAPPAEVVEKVKKLLRLAADKSNRHEAELALRRAFELARRHSIDVSALDLDEKTEAFIHQAFPTSKRITTLELRAVGVVRHFFRVNAVLGCSNVTFIGRPSDIAIAGYAFDFIIGAGKREIHQFQCAEKKARRKLTHAKRENFVQGFIYGLTEQLRAAGEEVVLDDSTTALMVAEDARRQQRQDQLFPDTSAFSRKPPKKVRGALMSGWDAGQNTNLRTPLASGSGSRAPLALTLS
jgi:hypothetical protein